ncbi:MAG: type II secretion system protein [Pseudomonadota bacterium]
MHSESGEAQRGLTLLETLCALAIASYALIAAYGAFGGGLSSMRKTADRTALSLYAETILTDLETEALVVGERTGEGPDGVRWLVTIADYAEDRLANGDVVALQTKRPLFHVHILVENNTGDQAVLQTIKRGAAR